jgi:hypothetical protein
MVKLPIFSRSTIKNDPFAAVIPTSAERHEGPSLQIRAAETRKKITVHLRPDLIERVKNAAYWNPRLTIAAIAEAGILRAIEDVEKEYGGPYPAREQELRGGRPMK